jgi:hypothetical protein
MIRDLDDSVFEWAPIAKFWHFGMLAFLWLSVGRMDSDSQSIRAEPSAQ